MYLKETKPDAEPNYTVDIRLGDGSDIIDDTNSDQQIQLAETLFQLG